ncbi:MAG: transporter [Bacteroidota bacterium]|nr:transporter [Bacteroidota bacterium]MEC7478600.1 transporter [Bacteroidota bacterium]MEE2605297.1 transporter [Bacteroidota bacterium]
MKKHHIIFLFLTPLILSAQYTESINSNRPGTSHGAFSIGKDVLQFELGISQLNLNHKYLDNASVKGISINYNVRYGLHFENLELFLKGGFIKREITNFTINGRFFATRDEKFFNEHKVGLKYLIFDPFKNKKWHGVSMYSWKKNNRIRLTDFIPAISVFTGGDFVLVDHIQYDDHFYRTKQQQYLYPDQARFSPFFGIATQNHFQGKWVVVNNISIENLVGEYTNINYLFTLTHNLTNPKWSIFVEFQHFDNQIYSDNLFKFGIANLLSKNSQIDLNFGGSLKDTPTYSYFDLGFSQRIDWHKDVSPEEKERLKKLKESVKQQKKNQKSSNKNSKKLNKQNKKESKVNKRNIRKSNKSNKKKFLIF